jgi:hypothetical protein
MRAIALAVAAILVATPSARSQTLLETVLYIVSLHLPRDDEYTRVTIAQHAETVRGEATMKKSKYRWASVVTQIENCKFRVEQTFGANVTGFNADYIVDFANTDFEAVRAVQAPNRLGRLSAAVVLPGTHYCLKSGGPYFNAIEPGSCTDKFFVEPGGLPQQATLDRMFAAIDRLRLLCRAPVS